MLRAVLNKFWKQNPTKQQLYRPLPPISQTILKEQDMLDWRSEEELTSNVILCAPTHGPTSFGRPAKTSIHQFFEDTGCRQEDLVRWLMGTNDEREGGRVKGMMMMMMMMMMMISNHFI